MGPLNWLPLLEVTRALAPGDPVEPGLDRAIAAIGAHRLVGGEQGLLDDLFGVGL